MKKENNKEMMIILKKDALLQHSQGVPAHVGYSQATINWRKSISDLMNSSNDRCFVVDSKYLFENSFMIKNKDGSGLSIPDYMVEKVINDKRVRTEESFKKAFDEVSNILKTTGKPHWIVPTIMDYKVSCLKPKSKNLPRGTSAVLYCLENNEIIEKRSIKSTNGITNKI